MDQEVKRPFTTQPMVSYRSVHKLNSYLVRAKLYPIEGKVGSCKCKGKCCKVCENILETDTFTCSDDQTTYKINHKFDCNENFLVYQLTCSKCLKQHVGKTVDMSRSRWNNYKDNSRKFDRGEDCVQRHRYEHFQPPCQTRFLQHTYVTLIDKTDPIIVKITGFIPLRQKHLWGLMLKVVTELLSYIVIVQLFLFLNLDSKL